MTRGFAEKVSALVHIFLWEQHEGQIILHLWRAFMSRLKRVRALLSTAALGFSLFLKFSSFMSKDSLSFGICFSFICGLFC